MELLKALPEEFLRPLFSCFGLLKNCNMIFFDDRPFLGSILPYFYILPSVVAYHAALTIYMIESFKRGVDLDELVYVVPVYVVTTQSIFKASIVNFNKKAIRTVILKLGGIWTMKNLSDVQTTKKNVLLKRLNFCYTAFYWMNVIGSWQYILAPLLETLFRRYILQLECDLLLPFGCWFPFDTRSNWIVYILAYIFEGYSMFRIVYYYLGTEFLMITLCSHLGIQFTLLQEDLLQLKPGSKRDIAHFNAAEKFSNFDGIHEKVDEIASLKAWIRRHQILIALSQDVNEIFNKMIFVNLSSASISICFFGFSAKVARDAVNRLNNLVAVIALMLPLFNLCYYGQLLKEASEGIADAAYTNLWYHGTKEYMKAICFIIKRSQKSCSLTSLEYNPIALSTFTTVMSTTWSYFSLATSLYDETAKN